MRNKAIIDLVQLRENAKNIKNKLGTARFNAVVKADAYGHGGVEIATAIYDLVDSFSVAIPEEGVALRQAGIDKPILVLTEPFAVDLPLCFRYDLSITASRQQTLFMAQEVSSHRKIKVHLKVNTGMNRQGANSNGIEKLVGVLRECPAVVLDGVYSHLRAPENKKITEAQVDKFLLALKGLKDYNVIKHISASGGFLKGLTMDMCRIGLLLYGYKPFDCNFVKVKPIMKVVAPTIEKRKLFKGEGLLYGSDTLNEEKRVSIVRFGYADGLPRQKGELPANRCMDVSAYPSFMKECAVLDANADVLAKRYATIPYEILCNVTKRAERIYLR